MAKHYFNDLEKHTKVFYFKTQKQQMGFHGVD
jgi:hypothetical protein